MNYLTKHAQTIILTILQRKRIGVNPEAGLKESLIKFYKEFDNYDSFLSPRNFCRLHELAFSFRPKIVLEVGCGVSNAHEFFRDRGVVYHCQDITSQNKSYYMENDVKFFNSDINSLSGKYDVIFSTYVFEHVINPIDFLNDQLNLLNDNGKIILECPNYFLPFHIPPSIRHYPFWKQIYLTLFLAIENCLGKDPKFLINSNAAFLHTNWKRDYDAINLVSHKRLKRYCNSRGLFCSKNQFSFFSRNFWTSQLVVIGKQ